MGRSRIIAAAAALTVTVVLTTPATATAAAHDEAQQQGDRHCVAHAVPADKVDLAQPAPPTCFASFAAAIRFATDGTVRLPASATMVTQAQLDAGRATDRMASTVIGIEYEDTNFGGDDWIVSVASGCTDGGTERWTSVLTGTSWDNRISSARTYAGCKSRHYENSNFTGSQYLCGCSQMSVMSDRTSAILWSSSGI